MKRHLILIITSLCMSTPLVAQDGYYSDSDSDGNSRHFNFNPGNMMNGMTNPMRSMFGSSRRGYDDYPGAGYPPPYPPTYGYPAYQPAHPGYAQPYQAPPAPTQASPYNYPSAVPAPAEPVAPAQAPAQAPAYQPPTAAGQPYQPAFSEPAAASRYQFRPLEGTETGANPAFRSPSQAPVPAAAGATQPTPPGLGSQPAGAPGNQPLAPLNYPDPSAGAYASPAPVTQAPAPQPDPSHRFRPLDKPGYSDLDR